MSFALRPISSSLLPIDVHGILPEKLNRLSAAAVARLPIRQGNRTRQVGELFRISATGSSGILRWEGDLSSVHWIGSHMSCGEIVIEGSVGRHLGSQMAGGSIHVVGNVGDYAGCEMSGGQIRIDGRAGGYVGAAYPGNRAGMNRGTIIVAGEAGDAVGMGMRRGTIVVGGSLGRLAGWNMLAGTIVAGGRVGPMVGKGMVRGTILLAATSLGDQNRRQLPPTFSQAGRFRPVFVDLLSAWLREQTGHHLLPAERYAVYHGDHLKQARGEVLIAECD